MLYQAKSRTTICPAALKTETYSLSPLDIYSFTSNMCVAWPMFYTYDVDGQLLKDALNKMVDKFPLLCGRVKPCPQTRYVIEVKNSETEFGFPFTEQTSDLTIAEAVLKHHQVKIKSAAYPIYPEVSFFEETINVSSVLKGKDPVFAVKLTHFKDGCAVNFCMAHILFDGTRFMEVCRDISRAYCGQEIPDRDLDRSYLWPDQLVKHYPSLGEEVAKLPRQASKQIEVLPFASFPDESFVIEILYFSKETLDHMKLIAGQFLPAGSFVSSNDSLFAFFWLLHSELDAKSHTVSNGTDLDLAGTYVIYPADFLRNGAKVVPDNYTANAVFHLAADSTGLDVEGKSIQEVFSILASRIRGSLSQIRTQQPLQAQEIMMFYSIISTGLFPHHEGRMRAALASLVKTPILEIDFGSGSPALIPTCLSYPVFSELGATGPAPGNGVFLPFCLRSSHEDIFKNSVIVKECAPGVKRLYSDFSVEELEALFKET